MGAWIEILNIDSDNDHKVRRTPRWVRGLKLENFVEAGDNVPVAPHDGCVD